MEGIQRDAALRPPSGLLAKEFVPSSAAAKPFVPTRGGGALTAGAASFAPTSGSFTQPTGTQRGKGSLPSAALPKNPSQASSAGGTTAPSADHNLPEGDDDLLGLSSSTAPTATTKDITSQAAEMFRAMRPFQPGSGSGQGGGAGGSGGPGQGPQHAQQQQGMGPGGGRGRGLGSGAGGGPSGGGGGGRFPAQQQQQQQSGGRGGGGRGRGRGRGRGPPVGPGLTRPSVSAYAVSHGRMQLAGQFMAESLRQDMQQRSYLQAATLDTDSLTAAGLPTIVQQYHTLCPLEDPTAAGEHPSAALGVASYVFKGIHYGDGAAYAVRRLDGRQVLPTAELLAAADAAVERWGPVSNHPNIVGLREAFVSDEIDDSPALFLSYDYYPGALTLEQAHVLPTHTPQGLMRNPVTESQLWSYLVQLTGALRAVHTAGLAASPASLAPSKVLLMAPARVRLGSIGTAEVLAEGPPAEVARAQREDLSALGSLLLHLACAAHNAPPTLDALSANFSRELCHVVAGLLASGDGKKERKTCVSNFFFEHPCVS